MLSSFYKVVQNYDERRKRKEGLAIIMIIIIIIGSRQCFCILFHVCNIHRLKLQCLLSLGIQSHAVHRLLNVSHCASVLKVPLRGDPVCDQYNTLSLVFVCQLSITWLILIS